MLEKLQKAYVEVEATGEATISFDVVELSTLIALVKSNDVYKKTLEENMFKVFDK